MAIYHLEAKVISRSAGRSAVAAAAYTSCTRIENRYDGICHDYRKKRGCIYSEVLLPDAAPRAWYDRSELWNAVEDAEKSKDSRLARELIVALPRELKASDWIQLTREFIQKDCVSKGMCADFSIHNTDGQNPHAHILLTVRPLNPDGSWQAKTQKEYICRRNGEEKHLTPMELRSLEGDGWEKLYHYKKSRSKAWLTPSEASAEPGWVRLSKDPKSSRYGRQNPVSEEWNSIDRLDLWRSGWASAVNLALEKAERSERVDHRSNQERGLDEIPTIHEGYHARKMEKAGHISDRCEINRQIRSDNLLIRSLKAELNKLLNAVRNTIPAIAGILEELRVRLIFLNFRLEEKSFPDRSYGEDTRYTEGQLQREKTDIQTEFFRKNYSVPKEKQNNLTDERVRYRVLHGPEFLKKFQSDFGKGADKDRLIDSILETDRELGEDFQSRVRLYKKEQKRQQKLTSKDIATRKKSKRYRSDSRER
ncbi:MAG: MobQ family relaxase [Eubacterium sp.]|nr:MobQ family relaxase [Eubacterium sp.]